MADDNDKKQGFWEGLGAMFQQKKEDDDEKKKKKDQENIFKKHNSDIEDAINFGQGK